MSGVERQGEGDGRPIVGSAGDPNSLEDPLEVWPGRQEALAEQGSGQGFCGGGAGI